MPFPLLWLMRFLCLSLWLLATGPAVYAQQQPESPIDKDRRAIIQTLKRQSSDWNEGRVDRFMDAYWRSDSLTFVGKAGITYGYKATLASYKKRYPDRASMGRLDFDLLQLDFPAPDVAYVIGRWQLTRPSIGNATGYFTLLWRRIRGRWLIVSDHSN